MQPFISFIILDYHKAEKVCDNIKGILNQHIDKSFEILVGDNSKCEKNHNHLKQGIEEIKKSNNYIQALKSKKIDISLHIFTKNCGYSVGNNFLAKKATGKYFCILNPDIEWEDRNTMNTLISHIEQNKKIGIIAPRQQERTGKEALSIRSFPSFITQIARRTWIRNITPFSVWVEKDEMLTINRNKTQKVDWVQSSFLCISQKLWNEIGGFDERYFLFLADTQLCKDVWDQEKKVIYHAETLVFSDGIRCSEGGFLSVFTSKTLRIHLWDSVKYYWKNKTL